ncbi:hypothetical protein BSQ44_18010 [Aquibium oceanicum]|uniref:Uncharacterized protein n=2 Tax=Aquibium oceanicum TaxID=1670800 RepID=A0A1L3SUL4_9HYPH|nr:hypothetical protein BSQ44_18010 [Aquibium oceanicum]
MQDRRYHAQLVEAIRSDIFADMQYATYLIAECRGRLPEIEHYIVDLHKSDYEHMRSAVMEYILSYLMDEPGAVPVVAQRLGDPCVTVRAKAILWMAICSDQSFDEVERTYSRESTGFRLARIERDIAVGRMIRNRQDIDETWDKDDPYIKAYLSRTPIVRRYRRRRATDG